MGKVNINKLDLVEEAIIFQKFKKLKKNTNRLDEFSNKKKIRNFYNKF
jgi:hypothetical protein